MKKSRVAWIVTAIVVALVVAIALVKVPPRTECLSESPVVASQHWFPAMETEVQLWQGPHHVYGIFSVPDRYRRDRLYTARLVIQGFTEEFSEISPEGEDIYNDRAEPGHYQLRLYLPTRTALWFLLIGRFGDLKMTCHWWLVIADRKG